MVFEPAISAYLAVRRKSHGAGKGSRLRALKMALVMFSVSNGAHTRLGRAAFWIAIHGLPKLRKVRQ